MVFVYFFPGNTMVTKNLTIDDPVVLYFIKPD
jgi:hypothetical protein